MNSLNDEEKWDSRMKKITFIDTGVLIAAAKGQDEVAKRAMEILDDPERIFASSDFVRLEVLPKPLYFKWEDESEFYKVFFDEVGVWANLTDELVGNAFNEAEVWGLSAVDALHVAGAASVGAHELVTTEKPQKPLGKVKSVPIRSIHPAS